MNSFKSAQRQHDNELPPEDLPEPEENGALLCVCEPGMETLVYEFIREDCVSVRVKCHHCDFSGPWRSNCTEAVEAWNRKIEELRREE